MKIAFLLRYWPYYGGGETVTRVLVDEFLKRGVDIHILFWWHRNEGLSFKPSGNYYEYKFDVPETESYLPKSNISWLKGELTDYLNVNKIDFAINQWWPTNLIIPNQKTKIIRCWHTHALPHIGRSKNVIKNIYHFLVKNKIYREFIKNNEEQYYKESDVLVFLAEVYVKEFCKYSTIYPQKRKIVTYIHNPLTYRHVPVVDINKKEKEIIFVGRIEESVKRISRILFTWRYILNTGVNDWILKIIGDGPDLGTMKDLAKELGLNNIFFTGSKDPRDNYKTASILLVTSDIEGWPMTIVEGKSYGVVPLVMNTYSAAKEVVHHKSDGIVCDSTSISMFAKMLLSLMNDSKIRRQYALASMEDAKQYHVEKIVDQWMKLFSELG